MVGRIPPGPSRLPRRPVRINPETAACQRGSGEAWWANPPLSGLPKHQQYVTTNANLDRKSLMVEEQE